MKRVAMGTLLAILLFVPSVASAKIPWSSVETVPAAPVADEPVTIIVRFWDDAAHSQPSTWWPDPAMGASLALEGPAGCVVLTLTRIGDASYRAETTLAEGTWSLVADQPFSEATGPTDVELATVTVAPASGTTPMFGFAVIGLALLASGIVWHGRRPASATKPG